MITDLAGITVHIGFGADAVGGNYWVLDDPVKSELDNPLWVLAPDDVFVDITSHVAAIQTNRGRERELDEYRTGKATVVFNDNDRTFDPAYSASPYFGEIVPMKRIAIRWYQTDLFNGWVDDWSVSYEPGDRLSRITADCVDGFAILANQQLHEIGAAHSGDLTGERISRVLDMPEVNFPATRNIDDGVSVLGATTFGGNVLAYLQACARAEAGYLFVDADGVLTFRARTASLNIPASSTFSDDRTAGIPYRNITQRTTGDLLYTYVTGESETTSNPLDAINEEAADQFLIRTLALGTLYTVNDNDTQNLIDYYLSRFSTPELRFNSITLNLAALTTTQIQQVVSLRLTDLVTVQRSPLSVGATIDRFSMVDGVSHRIARGGQWVTELSFANADSRTFFQLDHPVFSQLDAGNRLAF